MWREDLYWIQVAQISSLARPCQHHNEPSGSLKGVEHIGQLDERLSAS
jgi:hypothetical protein